MHGPCRDKELFQILWRTFAHTLFLFLKPIDNKRHKEMLWNYILEFQRKVQPLKKLDWFNEPIPIGLVGKSLPAFSVTSTAFLTDTLHLLSHGGGILEGETFVDMEPGASLNDPSMAIFRNISFRNRKTNFSSMEKKPLLFTSHLCYSI